MSLELTYKSGSLCLLGSHAEEKFGSYWLWDERSKYFRSFAANYRKVLLELKDSTHAFEDKARAYLTHEFNFSKTPQPRKHQTAALEAWIKADMCGTICLPTGAGKSILALMIIEYTKRPSLIVVPTIDLMLQWQSLVKEYFAIDAGMLGGGFSTINELTIATYDSAALHFEKLGNKFGLLIFDECHHLPAPQYIKIAKGSLAPFRLGLSATVQRSDQKESLIFEYVGPLVYEASIHEMVDVHLSPYKIVTIEVAMSEKERAAYDQARELYLNFIRKNGIQISTPLGWQNFIMLSARSPSGKIAMQAYQTQKKLAQAAQGKLYYLWQIIRDHTAERMIVFTDNNHFAYFLGRTFLLPVLTHHTKAAERKRMLDEFKSGAINILITSKVLNEGVDVPEASVAVIMSGSATVREHVQRLGRILRHREGKQAILYELIAKDTSEKYVNIRRRQHDAYKRPH